MWLDGLKNYQSDIEQELLDKERILKAYDIFGDSLFDRENTFMHFTSSSMILNEDNTKALMVYHNIYDSYSWTGGHNDGDKDFLHVALKEAKEETGLKKLTLIQDDIASIEILPVKAHIKRGKYVGTHLHLNISYLFRASEKEELHIKEDENSNVKWIEIDKLDKYISLNDIEMLPIYRKILRNYL